MPENGFGRIADEWIAATLSHRPAAGTALGIHDHDGELGDRSRESIEGHARALRGFLQRLERIDPAALTSEERPEHELLHRRMLWELITIEERATWRTPPGIYLKAIGGGCNGLITRDFAPIEERVRGLDSRLRRAPAVLEQAKANL